MSALLAALYLLGLIAVGLVFNELGKSLPPVMDSHLPTLTALLVLASLLWPLTLAFGVLLVVVPDLYDQIDHWIDQKIEQSRRH